MEQGQNAAAPPSFPHTQAPSFLHTQADVNSVDGQIDNKFFITLVR